MKKLVEKCSLITLLVIGAFVIVNAQNVLWVKNATSSSSFTGSYLTIDQSNNIYVMGNYNYPDTIYFDDNNIISLSDNSNNWLAKYNSSGQVNWVNGSVGCAQFKIDNSGYIYTIGQTNINTSGNNIIVEKLDSLGNELWNVMTIGGAGGGGNRGKCIDLDNSGNYYIGGIIEQHDIVFDTISITMYDGKEGFVAKYDTNRNVQWVLNLWGYGDDEVNEISVDDNGNIAIVGTFEDTINIGNNVLISAGKEDFFLFKTDQNGNVLWAISEGGSEQDLSQHVGTDNLGNVYIGGYFASSNIFNQTTFSGFNMYVAKYSASNGALEWVKTAIGSYSDRPEDIVVSPSGNVILAGFISNSTAFGTDTLNPEGTTDFFLVKIDQSGNWQWAERYGDSNGLGDISTMALDNSGNIIFTGSYGFADNSQGTIDFNGTSLNVNTRDMLLAKIQNIDSASFITNANKLSHINIYPNPANNVFTVSVPTNEPWSFQLFDIMGNKVLDKQKIYSKTMVFETSNFTHGVYLFDIINAHGIKYGKIIIQ